MDERSFDNLGAWSYDELVGELESLREMVLLYRKMTPEQEREFRQGYSEEGNLPSEDFRTEFTVEDGQRQTEIVRECLKRVSVARLSKDTGFPENTILKFAAYRGRPQNPSRN